VDLAKQLKDPTLLEESRRALFDGELSTAAMVEIEKLHFECGDSAAALSWIERVPKDISFMVYERDQLLIEIYKTLNNPEKLAETLWRVALLAAIGKDKRDCVIAEQAKLILASEEFDCADAGFLIEMGRVDDADRYIVKCAKELDGDSYSHLLTMAKSILKHDRFVAATVIYRALLQSILTRASSRTYRHGVSYLKKLDSLAPKIRDWRNIQPRAEYLTELRQKHKRKKGFWSHYS